MMEVLTWWILELGAFKDDEVWFTILFCNYEIDRTNVKELRALELQPSSHYLQAFFSYLVDEFPVLPVP